MGVSLRQQHSPVHLATVQHHPANTPKSSLHLSQALLTQPAGHITTLSTSFLTRHYFHPGHTTTKMTWAVNERFKERTDSDRGQGGRNDVPRQGTFTWGLEGYIGVFWETEIAKAQSQKGRPW